MNYRYVLPLFLVLVFLAGCINEKETNETSNSKSEDTNSESYSDENTEISCPEYAHQVDQECYCDAGYEAVGGICTKVCNDGTKNGQCSNEKPKYCNEGTLIGDCLTCGCPYGEYCIKSYYSLNFYYCSTCSEGEEYNSLTYSCEKKESEYDTNTQSNCPDDLPLKRDYNWKYNNEDYSLSMCYPENVDNMKNRDRNRDYVHFVNDPYSKQIVELLTNELESIAANKDFGKYEKVEFVIAFVQALPYTSDKVTTGYDDYRRFPYETLYDDGGDCEDTSILMAALLNKMGYGTALIVYSDHVATGVKCTPSDFLYETTYYTKDSITYCYLETTGENWNVGKIPEAYADSSANVLPITTPYPEFNVVWSSNYSYNNVDTYVNVNINAVNIGSEEAKNVRLYVATDSIYEGQVWDQKTIENYDVPVDGSFAWTVTNLHVPSGNDFRVYIQVYGDNFKPQENTGQWVH